MGEVFVGSTPGERVDLLITHEFLQTFEPAIYTQAKGCPPGGRIGLMKRCLDDAINTLMDKTRDLFPPQRREAAHDYLRYQRAQLNRLHRLTRHGQELSWRVHEFESLLLNRYHDEEAITRVPGRDFARPPER